MVLEKYDHKALFYNKNNLEKIKVFLEYKFYVIASQKLHRLTRWSYTKKILDVFIWSWFLFFKVYFCYIQQTNSYTKYH